MRAIRRAGRRVRPVSTSLIASGQVDQLSSLCAAERRSGRIGSSIQACYVLQSHRHSDTGPERADWATRWATFPMLAKPHRAHHSRGTSAFIEEDAMIDTITSPARVGS